MLRLNSTIVPHICCCSSVLWLLHPGKSLNFSFSIEMKGTLRLEYFQSVDFVFSIACIFFSLRLQWLMLQFTRVFQSNSTYPHHLRIDNKKWHDLFFASISTSLNSVKFFCIFCCLSFFFQTIHWRPHKMHRRLIDTSACDQFILLFYANIHCGKHI